MIRGGEILSSAYGGMMFACLYGTFINLVYFTQLTTVANQTASPGQIPERLSDQKTRRQVMWPKCAIGDC